MSEMQKLADAWRVANNTNLVQTYIDIFSVARAWLADDCTTDPEEILFEWGLEADFVPVFIEVANQVDDFDSHILRSELDL